MNRCGEFRYPSSLAAIQGTNTFRAHVLSLWIVFAATPRGVGSYFCPVNFCAPGGIRTPNLLIRSQMLYPLSYGRVGDEAESRVYIAADPCLHSRILRSTVAETVGFEPTDGLLRHILSRDAH